MPSPSDEAARRRTFAIISHPDAGKTTLTEKFLLYGGRPPDRPARCKARGERRRGHLRLDGDGAEARHLDHLDRAAVPVPRRTCSTCSTPRATATSRRTPTGCSPPPTPRSWCSTRPRASSRRRSSSSRSAASATCRCSPSSTSGTARARRRSSCSTRSRPSSAIVPTPVTWPVGIAGDFRGVVDRRTGDYVRFTRTARGATEAGEELVDATAGAAAEEGDAWTRRRRRARPARRGRRPRRPRALPQGRGHPGVLRVGAHQLRRAACCSTPWSTWRPSPEPATTCDGLPRPLDAPVLGVRVQGAGQHGPVAPRPHRVRARAARGSSSAGMVVTHGPPASPSPPSTPTRCSARSATRSRRPGPAT